MIISKSPYANLDYSFDWNEWLDFDNDGSPDESIAVSTWEVPAGLTNNGETNSGNVAGIILEGGLTKGIYRVVNKITTSSGKKEQQTFVFRVAEK